jgi:HAD superfamily hydrolase (TIGR01484 family)
VHFLCLVTDYDGTIADQGHVKPEVVAALERLKATGRRLVLATGRLLDDLLHAFPEVRLFDRVVVENGAALYSPVAGEERVLAPKADGRLLARLKQLEITPLSVGRTVVATWEPNQTAAREAIRDLGLDLHIVFNKGAVMILPPNVDKASGVLAALAELEIPAHNAVGIGDAENDQAFLTVCGCSAAVANALPAIKENVDVVLNGARGAGAIELIDRMIHDDAGLVRSQRDSVRAGADTADD